MKAILGLGISAALFCGGVWLGFTLKQMQLEIQVQRAQTARARALLIIDKLTVTNQVLSETCH